MLRRATSGAHRPFVARCLTVPLLQPDRDYLNAIRDSWLSLKPVGRTTLRAVATVMMCLRNHVSDFGIDVTIPDTSGESFSMQWATRKATAGYAAFAKNCDGAFLFIHPNEVRTTHALKPNREELPTTEPGQSTMIAASISWTPEQSSSQVQFVDLLQTLMYLRDTDASVRLAVVISAWDVIGNRVRPIDWIEKRLPLLSQFLSANHRRIPSRVFGISAQGGDLDQDRQRLLNYALPSERCMVIEADEPRPVHISAPLLFLLGSIDIKTTVEI
jgi:hypothetical protein